MNEDAPSGAASELRSLSEAECWKLLAAHNLGRLAIVVDGWPEVFPVNYASEEGSIVFRTASGTKLAHGPASRACFEIDG